jgi:hypothetical protein
MPEFIAHQRGLRERELAELDTRRERVLQHIERLDLSGQMQLDIPGLNEGQLFYLPVRCQSDDPGCKEPEGAA